MFKLMLLTNLLVLKQYLFKFRYRQHRGNIYNKSFNKAISIWSRKYIYLN